MAETEVKDEKKYINLCVKDVHGSQTHFKIKRTMEFRKLIQAYCERVGVTPSSVRFQFDGNRLNESETPETAGMEDEDVIEVLTGQVGGDA